MKKNSNYHNAFQLKYPPLEEMMKYQKEEDCHEIIQIKPTCLILAQINGELDKFKNKDGQLDREMELILRTIPSYIDIILVQTMWLINLNKQGQSQKRITCQNILAIL